MWKVVKCGDHHLKSTVSKVEKGFPHPLTLEDTLPAFHALSRIVCEERMGIVNREISGDVSQGFGLKGHLQR